MTFEPESEREKDQTRRRPYKAPVIIRILHALKRRENRREKRNSQHQINEQMMAQWTRHVGVFTGALVLVGIVTAVIFWRQLNVMQGQLDEMKGGTAQTERAITATNRLADAAQKQEGIAQKTFVGMDRPWVFLVFPRYYSDYVAKWEYGTEINDSIKFNIFNYGRSPAILRSVYCAPIITKHIPTVLNISHDPGIWKIAIVNRQVLGSSSFISNISCTIPTTLSSDNFPIPKNSGEKFWARHMQIIQGEFWLVAWVNYFDVYNMLHRTTVCMRTTGAGYRLVEAGGPDCNKHN